MEPAPRAQGQVKHPSANIEEDGRVIGMGSQQQMGLSDDCVQMVSYRRALYGVSVTFVLELWKAIAACVRLNFCWPQDELGDVA